MRLQDAVVLVTGSNRGLGRAFAEVALTRGARRVYAAARQPKTLEPVVALDPARVVPLEIDVMNVAQVRAAAARAADVTLLINNAGVANFGSVLSSPQELIVRDVATNYYGTLHMIRAFAPTVERGGGSIVNVLSIVALASMPGLGAYNASKAAAWSLTQSVRAELGRRGVSVFGIYPGAVDTDMIRALTMPKTSPTDLAEAAFDGIEAGTEDIFPDAMARQFYADWTQDHKAVEHRFGAM